MTIYIQAIDFQLWSVITRGPHTPTKRVDGIDIPKDEEEWDDHDIKMIEINVKTMNLLYYVLTILSLIEFLLALCQNKFGINYKLLKKGLIMLKTQRSTC